MPELMDMPMKAKTNYPGVIDRCTKKPEPPVEVEVHEESHAAAAVPKKAKAVKKPKVTEEVSGRKALVLGKPKG
jgi:hypothetical protein